MDLATWPSYKAAADIEFPHRHFSLPQSACCPQLTPSRPEPVIGPITVEGFQRLQPVILVRRCCHHLLLAKGGTFIKTARRC